MRHEGCGKAAKVVNFVAKWLNLYPSTVLLKCHESPINHACMTSKLNDNLSFLACHIHSAILVVVKGKSWINCVRYFNCYLVLKERHVRKESLVYRST